MVYDLLWHWWKLDKNTGYRFKKLVICEKLYLLNKTCVSEKNWVEKTNW